MAAGAVFAAFGCLVAIYCLLSIHGYAGTSDKATVLLEGEAIDHGHVLLHGWYLPLDSYWTSDALLSALGVAIFHVRPLLVHLEPAVSSGLFVAAAVVVAGTGTTHRGARVAATATVLCLLVAPAPMFEFFLVTGSYHVGSALWALLAFMALRSNRFGRAWVVAVCCLAIGLLGDLDVVAFGVIPVALAGLAAAARSREPRRGLPGVAAAGASIALYVAVRAVAASFGGFVATARGPLVPLDDLGASVRHLGLIAGDFFGAIGFYGGYAAPVAVRVVHLVTGAVVLAALLAALGSMLSGIRRGPTARIGSRDVDDAQGAPLLDDLLALGVISSAGMFALQAVLGVADGRYFTVAALLACVLCARVTARVWPRSNTAGRRLLVSAGAVVAAMSAWGLGSQLDRPVVAPVTSELATWLEAHHLRTGLGGYWASSITTVDSAEHVDIRPVVVRGGVIRPLLYQSNASWYSAPFQFLVATGTSWTGATRGGASTSNVAHEYEVDGYRVVVWRRPVRVHAS